MSTEEQTQPQAAEEQQPAEKKSRSKKTQQVDAQVQTAEDSGKEFPGRIAEQEQSKEVVESHAQLLEMAENERTEQDIQKLMTKLGQYHAQIQSQQRPNMVIKDKFGKTPEYYADIIEYMTYANDVFLGGDIHKQKRLLVLLTDINEENGAMEKIQMEGLSPENYTINK